MKTPTVYLVNIVWLIAACSPTFAEEGRQIAEREGCFGCHGDDAGDIGPSWEGLYGTTIHLGGGEYVVADEDYIRESILQPDAKAAHGAPGAMPAYTELTEREIEAITAYIRSLQDEQTGDAESLPE